MSALDIDHLRQWIGRTETARDLLTPRMVRELNVTLDRPAGDPQPGEVADPHRPLVPGAAGGAAVRARPGRPSARGGFLPPVPLPRRMWAGFWSSPAPSQVGDVVERRSRASPTSRPRKAAPASVLRHRGA